MHTDLIDNSLQQAATANVAHYNYSLWSLYSNRRPAAYSYCWQSSLDCCLSHNFVALRAGSIRTLQHKRIELSAKIAH